MQLKEGSSLKRFWHKPWKQKGTYINYIYLYLFPQWCNSGKHRRWLIALFVHMNNQAKTKWGHTRNLTIVFQSGYPPQTAKASGIFSRLRNWKCISESFPSELSAPCDFQQVKNEKPLLQYRYAVLTFKFPEGLWLCDKNYCHGYCITVYA